MLDEENKYKKKHYAPLPSNSSKGLVKSSASYALGCTYYPGVRREAQMRSWVGFKGPLFTAHPPHFLLGRSKQRTEIAALWVRGECV